nr:abortive infection family protein [Chthonobacter rhizosphaerae]
MLLQGILITRATGGQGDSHTYSVLRTEFIQDSTYNSLLPAFVRTCRTLDQFWSWIKYEADTYQARRDLIYRGFLPLLQHLELGTSAPSDPAVTEALRAFDPEGVHEVWSKAIQRRATDPEGAITMARTLVETVCKHILDAAGTSYGDEDLPKLYRMAAGELSLAPSQHTEETFKTILGSAQTIVNTLGTIRNRVGDAHGQGSRPVRPSPRHAALAVNLAGAMAMFLVETELARREVAQKR